MAQRIRLTWDRNQDRETKFYRVYRSETPTIDHHNRHEYLVMKVEHPTEINPITIEQEYPQRISSRTYLLEHKNILLHHNGNDYSFIVRVNGKIYTEFLLDTLEGTILFDESIPSDQEVVVDQYTFDGVQVWDYDLEEDGKTYYGPEGKDLSSPTAPSQIQLEPDYEKNRVLIRYSTSKPQGKLYYYRVDAAKNENDYSNLSEWKTGRLQEPLADRPYIIENSLDGIEWRQIAKVKGTVFYEYMIDRHAPDPVEDLKSAVFLYSQSSLGQVTLTWKKPKDLVFSQSPMYRVRAINRVGAISEPSHAVGPIPFQVGLKEIVIRRKINDGTLPTFAGEDAYTVAVLDPASTKYTEDVEDNREYVYGVWLIDRAGNKSNVAYLKVAVGDATAPNPVSILSIDELQLVTG